MNLTPFVNGAPVNPWRQNADPIGWWTRQIDPHALDLIAEGFRSGNVSYGTFGRELESAICLELGMPFATVVTSGSAALLTCLRVLGVGPGDEVIMPTRTFQATANAAVFLGARVIPIDVDSKRCLMDPGLIEAAITPRTRAIIPVHLNGRICEMEKILDIGKRYSVPVIEDAAQALLSRDSAGFAGCFALAGIFSLGITKLITSGQGGVIVTRDQSFHNQVRKFLRHGLAESPEECYPTFGFNFRLADTLSAIALGQVRDPNKVRERAKWLYAQYAGLAESLPWLTLLACRPSAGEIPTWIEVLCENRQELVRHLGARNIECRSFGPSLHESEYLNTSIDQNQWAQAERFRNMGLILPSGPGLDQVAWDRISQALCEWKGSLAV